jgi:hypothetical protein
VVFELEGGGRSAFTSGGEGMGDRTGFGRLVRRPTLLTILEYLRPAVSFRWTGEVDGRSGTLPASYVKLL